MDRVRVRDQAEPVVDRSELRSNESVVPPACQHSDPAEIPVSTGTAASQAERRAVSYPCSRHKASSPATLPPITQTTSCSRRCPAGSGTFGMPKHVRWDADIRQDRGLVQPRHHRWVVAARRREEAHPRRPAHHTGQVDRVPRERREGEPGSRSGHDATRGRKDRRHLSRHAALLRSSLVVLSRLGGVHWPDLAEDCIIGVAQQAAAPPNLAAAFSKALMFGERPAKASIQTRCACGRVPAVRRMAARWRSSRPSPARRLPAAGRLDARFAHCESAVRSAEDAFLPVAHEPRALPAASRASR